MIKTVIIAIDAQIDIDESRYPDEDEALELLEEFVKDCLYEYSDLKIKDVIVST